MNEKNNTKSDETENAISVRVQANIRRPIPDDVHEIWCEYVGYINARDEMINKKIMGYKKAKKFARDAEKARLLFWKKCNEIYPEANKMTYYAIDQEVSWEK